MNPRPTPLPRLLVTLLLLWQAVAAPAYGLAQLARSGGIPICTAGGLTTAHGQEDGGPASQHGDCCAICHLPPQGPAPHSATPGAPGWQLAEGSAPLPLRAAPPYRMAGEAYAARAPPRA
ncbi:hypothetical protein [Roseomonas marmotae]|uniref:DUF2946 domain-containing protein n=1 Tax=Roseomonas marmotae TaxID=2768161 RepID=A0ABS3KJ14_9PROT|nr:hypothetical protein [Roseomonas marmotae]MBO1076326.1 hypothetical protein [Roseomonas marmotae]QTI80561.1 hypothetical protein IAI58_07475 [Roseomonas marmotae]